VCERTEGGRKKAVFSNQDLEGRDSQGGRGNNSLNKKGQNWTFLGKMATRCHVRKSGERRWIKAARKHRKWGLQGMGSESGGRENELKGGELVARIEKEESNCGTAVRR